MCWGSFWGTGWGWHYGMLLFPLLFIVFIGLALLAFRRIDNNSFQRISTTNNEVLLDEVKSLRQEVEELQEQKNRS